VKAVKPGDDVLVFMEPGAGYKPRYEPMRVVEVEGAKEIKIGQVDYINLAPYISKDHGNPDCHQWVWNDSEMCTKQYSQCYTPEHPGFDAARDLVWLDKRKKRSSPVCRKQHCDPKPITALRPPIGIVLDEVGGPRRGGLRRRKGGAVESKYRTFEVSPGLHQKAMQVIAEDAVHHQAEWLHNR
jgi:hypothetical protein